MSEPIDPREQFDEHDEWDALAVGWALSALDPEDEDRFAEHLPECSRCTATVRESLYTVADLAYALPDEAPPPSLKSRLMAAVAAEPRTGAGPEPDVPVAGEPEEEWPLGEPHPGSPGYGIDWFAKASRSEDAPEDSADPTADRRPAAQPPAAESRPAAQPPAGPAGPAGPTGAAGPAGPTGAAGPAVDDPTVQTRRPDDVEPDARATDAERAEVRPAADAERAERTAGGDVGAPAVGADLGAGAGKAGGEVGAPVVGADLGAGAGTVGGEVGAPAGGRRDVGAAGYRGGDLDEAGRTDPADLVSLAARRRQRVRRVSMGVAAAAVVALIAGLLAWNVSLRNQKDDLRQVVAQRDAAIQQLTANGPARIAALTSDGKPSPQRQATLVVRGDQIEIIVESLGATTGDETYWLWTLRCDTPQPSDLKPIRGFTVTQSDFSVRDIGSDPGVASAPCFAISSELGSATPTAPRQVVAVGQPE